MFKNQIGAIIRINRLQQNMSIRSLAKAVGIEFSQLSKIERGLESSRPITLESIFEALDLQYQETLDYIPICIDKVEKLYHDIFYRKPRHRIEKQINELNQEAIRMGTSTQSLLINFVYDVLYNEKAMTSSGAISLLKKVEASMSPFQKQLYYQYTGFYSFLDGEPDNALNQLDMAETLYLNDRSSAMIAYQKGVIYNHCGDTFEAYEHLNKAKSLFERHHNYIRSAFCSVSIASVLLLVDKPHKAMIIYQELLNSYEDLMMEMEDITLICSSMLLGCLMNSDFKQFFKIETTFNDSVITHLNQDSKYIFYRIIALFQTQRYTECLIYIERFEALTEKSQRIPLISYYKLKIKDASKKNLYGTLKLSFNTDNNEQDYHFIKLMLRLIIKEYEGSGDYKTLFQYAMKLAQIR